MTYILIATTSLIIGFIIGAYSLFRFSLKCERESYDDNYLDNEELNEDDAVPAIPPDDYEGTQADWMILLQEKGYWDGEGFHGDVMIPYEVWLEMIEKCESK